MKRILFLLAFVLCFVSEVIPQNTKDIDRKELQNLLEERKAKFDSYSVSIEKRSGFFGNKSKSDIKHSNEVLIDIVKTDNRIISNLYRVVDFRNYEKVNMSYDFQKRDEALENLRHATDTLSKQLVILKDANRDLKSKSSRLTILLYILSFLVIWTFIRIWRMKTSYIEH